jgi:TonB family protein
MLQCIMRVNTLLVLSLVAAIGSTGVLTAQTQSAPETPYKVGGGVKPPRLIYSPEPPFSEKARAAGYQGVCTLSLVVGTDGIPRNLKVVNSLGMGLDEKAMETVSKWKFQPATKDGNPVAVPIEVEVDFHLYGAHPSKVTELEPRANAGDAKAQLELANVYFKGEHNPEDDRMGMSYLEKSAKQGLARAQFEMGERIAHGDVHRDGASTDYSEAYMWYTLASRGGYKHSQKALKELTVKMTPEQVQAGQTLVDRWSSAPAKNPAPK